MIQKFKTGILSSKRLLPLLAFGVPFGVYCWTMAGVWALDTIYAIDSAEMVIAAHTLGIDHPPGHPLYLILAHLFSLLPFALPDGGVIFTSAVFGALAACFLTLAVYERTGGFAAALGAGWTVAFGFVFWIHATIAEVYTLQLTFLGLFLYLSARWLRTRENRILVLLIFSLGLGATTNILLISLLAPAAFYLTARSGAFVKEGRWQKRRILTTLLWGIVGLTPFLYIPIRLAQESGFITDFVYLNGYEVQSPRWYWWYLSAEEFTTTKLFDTPLARYPALIVAYMQSYGKNLSPASSILAVAGLGLVIFAWLQALRKKPARPDRRSRKERRQAETKAKRSEAPRANIWLRLFSRSPRNNRLFETVLLIAFLCTLFPVLSYQVPDRDVFFMPSFFFLTVFVGMGLHQINRSITARLPHRLSLLGGLVVALAIPLYLFIHHFSALIQITGNSALYQARLERFENLPENAAIIGEDDGHATRYKYFQIVRGLRPDVSIHTLGRLAPRFMGEIALDRSVRNAGDVRLSLNVADRLRILNGLIEQAPDRPTYAILDDRMPPEYDHFRTVRSPLDPNLLKIEPKPPAEQSSDPLPVVVHLEEAYFKDLRFAGFEIEGLDRGISKTFGAPLTFGPGPIDGIVKRGELFELAFVVQRTGGTNAKFFAEFAFVNDRMEIPSVHGFSASKHLEIIPEDLPQGWYRKDRFIFKIPGFISAGRYTLAARVNRTTGRVQGTYQGKPIHTLTPLQTLKPWKGQYDYQPLGRIWVE